MPTRLELVKSPIGTVLKASGPRRTEEDSPRRLDWALGKAIILSRTIIPLCSPLLTSLAARPAKYKTIGMLIESLKSQGLKVYLVGGQSLS